MWHGIFCNQKHSDKCCMKHPSTSCGTCMHRCGPTQIVLGSRPVLPCSSPFAHTHADLLNICSLTANFFIEPIITQQNYRPLTTTLSLFSLSLFFFSLSQTFTLTLSHTRSFSLSLLTHSLSLCLSLPFSLSLARSLARSLAVGERDWQKLVVVACELPQDLLQSCARGG